MCFDTSSNLGKWKSWQFQFITRAFLDPLPKDETMPFTRLKCDWTVNERWLNGIISSIQSPFKAFHLTSSWLNGRALSCGLWSLKVLVQILNFYHIYFCWFCMTLFSCLLSRYGYTTCFSKRVNINMWWMS